MDFFFDWLTTMPTEKICEVEHIFHALNTRRIMFADDWYFYFFPVVMARDCFDFFLFISLIFKMIANFFSIWYVNI